MAIILTGRVHHNSLGSVIYASVSANQGTTGTTAPTATPATIVSGVDQDGKPVTYYKPGSYTPAIGTPVANYPEASVQPIPPAAWWRINITKSSVPGQQPGLSAVRFYDKDGNQLIQYGSGFDAINGTPISSPSAQYQPASQGFYGAASASYPGWLSAQGDVGYLGWHFPTPQQVSRITFSGYRDQWELHGPGDFTVEYSQNGQDWIVVNTIVGEPTAYVGYQRAVVVDATTIPRQNHSESAQAYPMPTGAYAAYSLRKIVADYDGPLVAVNTGRYGIVNVFPTIDGNLDVDFLQAMMNEDGTIGVSTWFDQSGNERHATVVSSMACPLIVEGGVPTTSVNGRTALHMHPRSPFDLPFGPLKLGVTVQAIAMIKESNNWPTLVANQLTDGITASIAYDQGNQQLILGRNGQAATNTSLRATFGITHLLSATWTQAANNTVTGGFTLNGHTVPAITLDYGAKANDRGRLGQSFQAASSLGGDGINDGYLSEVLFYPAEGADTAGSQQALSDYFGIPLTA